MEEYIVGMDLAEPDSDMVVYFKPQSVGMSTMLPELMHLLESNTAWHLPRTFYKRMIGRNRYRRHYQFVGKKKNK